MAMISSLNDWNRPMASYKETFSAYYDALTEDVDRAVIADRCDRKSLKP